LPTADNFGVFVPQRRVLANGQRIFAALWGILRYGWENLVKKRKFRGFV
jgi:hypothetical protein